MLNGPAIPGGATPSRFGGVKTFAALRSVDTAGRLLCGKDWLTKPEEATGKQIIYGKPGPKSPSGVCFNGF